MFSRPPKFHPKSCTGETDEGPLPPCRSASQNKAGLFAKADARLAAVYVHRAENLIPCGHCQSEGSFGGAGSSLGPCSEANRTHTHTPEAGKPHGRLCAEMPRGVGPRVCVPICCYSFVCTNLCSTSSGGSGLGAQQPGKTQVSVGVTPTTWSGRAHPSTPLALALLRNLTKRYINQLRIV